jgi:acetyl esterase/lipase
VILARGRLAIAALCLALAACETATVPTGTPGPTLAPTAAPTPQTSTSLLTPTPSGLPTASTTPDLTDPSPTPTPDRTTGELNIWKTIPYATTGDCGVRVTECQQFVDVYAPDDPGPWPVVVMVHGRPRTPADMVELAKAVARHGAVVFNADYRGVRPVEQKGWPYAIDDVACAVRFARATAASYGGDASRLMLVGHSFGGYVGTLVALAGDDFHGDCLAPDESALPDAWVGIDANCLVGVPPPPDPLWSVFYGGTPEEKPRAWEKGDPLNHIGGNPGLVVRMIHERDDPIVDIIQPRTLVRELREADYDAKLIVIEGDDHWGPLDVDEDGDGAVSVDIIEDLLERL